MAAGKNTAVDFDKIIQADRQRRKNEALAHQIFGRGRRASAPGNSAGIRKPGTGPSLASRVGVAKRTASSIVRPVGNAKTVLPAGNVNADWTHDLHAINNPTPSRALQRVNLGRPGRDARLFAAVSKSALSAAQNGPVNGAAGSKPSKGMSIRGIAGPCIVVAQNFAPGTTAADIESAMAPVGGVILKCGITATRPMVVAEIIFETRDGADNVIDTFNNQTADGRLLRLHIKPSPVNLPPTLEEVQSDPTPLAPRAITPLGPRAQEGRSTRYGASDRYLPRERSRERRRNYDDEKDDMDMDQQMDVDDNADDRYGNQSTGRGLYSDDLVNSRGGRGSARGAGNRGRAGDRGRRYR